MSDSALCPLCLTLVKSKQDDYYDCSGCGGVFLDEQKQISPAEEKKRYETHNNDVNDQRYRDFVLPISAAVLREQAPDSLGLDFGAGTGPVISAVLAENGYNISQYDLFFSKDSSRLQMRYDYLVCCEVVEHFRAPGKEFRLLKNLLRPGGALYIMTDIYTEAVDFKNWYYRKDPTHIFFYRPETFAFIAEAFGFTDFSIEGRLVILRCS